MNTETEKNTAQNPTENPAPRPLRSYILRQGRLTTGQRNALADLWPLYGLDPKHSLDARTVFGRRAPLIVEIGFGNGETLARMALVRPDMDFIGIEVHRPGVGHLLLRLRDEGVGNVRVYCADALEVLARNIPDGALTGIHLFFPDPWPKKRHHKRRLVSPGFMALAARKLERGGRLHAATDWEDYARRMLEVMEDCAEFENSAGRNAFSLRPLSRPLTKFEQRGQGLGHGVWDLIFVRR